MKDVVPSAETRKAARRLERHVGWHEGFWLGFVFTIQPPQAHFIQARVEVTLEAAGRNQRVLRPHTPTQLLGLLPEIFEGAEWGCTWIEAIRERNADSDAWTQAWVSLVLRLNERREQLRSRLDGGLVFVAHPEIKPDLRTAAPDLWSVRTLVFELPPGPRSAVAPVELGAAWDIRTVDLVDVELLGEDLQRLGALDDEPLEQRSRGLARLAARLRSAGRYEHALDVMQTAVDGYRELAQDISDEYLPGLAGTLNDVSVLEATLGRSEAAFDAAQESVEVWGKLAKANPDEFLRDFAMSLNTLGNALSNLRRYEEALAVTEKAVQICRKLVGTHPEQATNLAMVLDSLGNRLTSLERPEEALAAASEALAEYRKLVSASPDVYLPDLARTLINFGMRLWSLGRLEEALAATQEGLERYRELSSANPDVFLPDVARALGALGSLLRDRGEFEASMSAFEEALRILEPFYRDLPTAFGRRRELLIDGLRTTCKEGGLTPPSDLQPLLEGAQ